MAKFKVGDRVRDCDGDEATVLTVFGDRHVEVEWCGYEGLRGKWLQSHFELVSTPGPVRTVTRREIVPGRYGIVTITDFGDINIVSSRKPEELREAARIFTEIADVLDDGNEEAA